MYLFGMHIIFSDKEIYIVLHVKDFLFMFALLICVCVYVYIYLIHSFVVETFKHLTSICICNYVNELIIK